MPKQIGNLVVLFIEIFFFENKYIWKKWNKNFIEKILSYILVYFLVWLRYAVVQIFSVKLSEFYVYWKFHKL